MSESRSFTYISPWTGKTETRYCHECLRCRKEYTATFERGNSGWCSHYCQTLAMADVYKEDVLKAGEIMTSKHFVAIAKAMRDAYHSLSLDSNFVSNRPTWERLVKSLADVCANTNPRFNRKKFVSACYPEAKNNED